MSVNLASEQPTRPRGRRTQRDPATLPSRLELVAYRNELGLSQIEMAKALGMVQGDYGRLERGEGMRMSKGIRIAKQLAALLNGGKSKKKSIKWRELFVQLWLDGESDAIEGEK